MERTKFPKKKPKIYDAINFSQFREYTAIPNEILRNPDLSCKAKMVLCLLLANKTGWTSYQETLLQMMKENKTVLRTALQELEEYGYLLRVRYRNKKTGIIAGSFWAYTDIPGVFNMGEQLNILEKEGYSIEKTSWTLLKPTSVRFPTCGETTCGESHTKNTNKQKILINKNTNTTLCDEKSHEEEDKKITKSMFIEFWQDYPKKIDRGKAQTKWNTICNKPPKERPTLDEIKQSIAAQKETPRWSDPQFIPHPTTWLNQSRWLDDPELMTSFSNNGVPSISVGTHINGSKFKYKKEPDEVIN